jgi:hypothetical protein
VRNPQRVNGSEEFARVPKRDARGKGEHVHEEQ